MHRFRYVLSILALLSGRAQRRGPDRDLRGTVTDSARQGRSRGRRSLSSARRCGPKPTWRGQYALSGAARLVSRRFAFR